MYIGIPKERRPFEFRVGLSPAGVEILAQLGNTVFVEHDAGVGASLPTLLTKFLAGLTYCSSSPDLCRRKSSG
jgi:NAD/NADP transhydrogenase alpha subunit